MLENWGIAATIATFGWWFFTGAILVVIRLFDPAPLARRVGLCLASLPAVCVAGLFYNWAISAADTQHVYAAFFCVLVFWGWIEISFLSGVITGPIGSECPSGISEWERFIRAWGTVAYHEMLLLAAGLVLTWVTWGAENRFGLWIYYILYFARISAKLNLFFGVPRINIEFVPQAMRHLTSHFRISSINWFFPVSTSGLAFALACWLERLYAVDAIGDQIGFALLSAMTALALLEHWVMVLPVPDAKLWRWMLPAPKHTKNKSFKREDFHGF